MPEPTTVVAAIGRAAGGPILASLRSRWGRRQARAYWTAPDWTPSSQNVGRSIVPVVKATWAVRGSEPAQGVVVQVRDPRKTWRTCSSPKGTVSVPTDRLYTYVDLRNGTPFNATAHSPADLGKPVEDLRGQAILGQYRLRITWSEPSRPKKRYRVEYRHKVR